jgi:hypothetical protein
MTLQGRTSGHLQRVESSQSAAMRLRHGESEKAPSCIYLTEPACRIQPLEGNVDDHLEVQKAVIQIRIQPEYRSFQSDSSHRIFESPAEAPRHCGNDSKVLERK